MENPLYSKYPDAAIKTAVKSNCLNVNFMAVV